MLAITGWPSREYVDARMRHDGFPKPKRRVRSLGDQWLESEVTRWIMGDGPEADDENPLVKRFRTLRQAT